MKPNTKSLTFEELYNQIFNDGIITKQNKDILYKSAKAINIELLYKSLKLIQ